ncbi:hypothetical protein COX74_01380 [bacterium (Candidatus Gribaldobacteria) CG_4_10_14_0_2_um_filter_41_16]|uniref:Glycosyltransferase subfamily 4-like N-terminal domain-containing protein n=1 Tax=bacterium (Candidatus Gribaldobacteria) CG_4_10_14_0_2_um_filter_41_16 TaxID=2014265 RepID=A0A2M7VIN7_9BACT|nr:MAG: hypothetical protein COX74_01380 [bacterium (Candidatus Gribaldobacteria) CG_4_10_14_0_2_um_filter_41_16]
MGLPINSMNLIYITNSRLPTEKAYGYQIVKMCEQFAELGVEVVLLAPSKKNSIEKEPFEFYDVKKNFKFKKISCPDFFVLEKYLGELVFYLQSFYFFVKLCFYNFGRPAIIYSRNPEIIWQFSRRGYRTVYDAHIWPASKLRLFKFFLKKVDKIVCSSRGLENEFKANGFKPILVAPNGVDLKKIAVKETGEELRQLFRLPLNKKIVMYAGHLYGWKGVASLLEAARLMKQEPDLIFVLVGGTAGDVTKHKNLIEQNELGNILLCGHQPHELILKYFKCADVLLLPNSAQSKVSAWYTSPIKMFEYMASRRPIIASDLPSLREILNEGNCLFFRPDDAGDLAEKIKQLLNDPLLAEKISKQALADVQPYGWDKRAQKIIKFIAA